MRLGTVFSLLMLALMLAPAPLQANPLALVYRGPAGCDGCSEAVAHVLKTSTYKFDVVYVGPGEKTKITPDALSKAAIYAQPGGGDDIGMAVRSIGPKGREAVREFVRAGGRYLGICMGAYLAASPGFEIIDGEAVSYVGRPGSLVDDDADTVTPVIWGGRKRWVYFQSGSTILYAPGAAGVNVLARYPNNDIAASVSSFGAGRVGISGPHPEADQSWYDSEGLKNPGPHADLAQDLLAATMKGWR